MVGRLPLSIEYVIFGSVGRHGSHYQFILLIYKNVAQISDVCT